MNNIIKDIFLIGNKPKRNYNNDYTNLIKEDSIVMRVNRMMSIDIGLSGTKTDMLFCDQFAFNWDDDFVNHVIKVNPNMHMVIPYHSKEAFEQHFKYDFNINKSNVYPNIKIDIIGHDAESYYKDYIKESMPQIELTFGHYWPTNVSYALQYLLNNFIYKTENMYHMSETQDELMHRNSEAQDELKTSLDEAARLKLKVNRKDDNIIYRINLIGIDAHDRVNMYKDAPANNPIVHQAFSLYEGLWFERLEKDNIIRIFD